MRSGLADAQLTGAGGYWNFGEVFQKGLLLGVVKAGRWGLSMNTFKKSCHM